MMELSSTKSVILEVMLEAADTEMISVLLIIIIISQLYLFLAQFACDEQHCMYFVCAQK